MHNLFAIERLAGQYQHEYKEYQNFFETIAASDHQSHLILISHEECSQIYCLDEELYPVKCFELSGMYSVEILKNKDLQDEDRWQELIELYEGSPAYLQDIAVLISNIFDGKVADFLAENSLVITQNMQSYFDRLFARLSLIERQLIIELSRVNRPISREELRQKIDLSSTDFVNSLQSLQQRYLVRKINDKESSFNLSPVFKEYVKKQRC